LKKKFTFLTLAFALVSLVGFSQQLQNTTWTLYDSGSVLIGYFNFDTDTVSFSSNSTTYSNTATYIENGNNFTVFDLPGGNCPVIDTGLYTFLIQNDTLKFTLLSDFCASRISVLTTYFWVRLLTGMQNVVSLSTVKVFPNPATDEISIISGNNDIGISYLITDLQGKQLLIGRLLGETTTVDIKQLSAGLYFLQIGVENKQQIKVLKQ